MEANGKPTKFHQIHPFTRVSDSGLEKTEGEGGGKKILVPGQKPYKVHFTVDRLADDQVNVAVQDYLARQWDSKHGRRHSALWTEAQTLGHTTVDAAELMGRVTRIVAGPTLDDLLRTHGVAGVMEMLQKRATEIGMAVEDEAAEAEAEAAK